MNKEPYYEKEKMHEETYKIVMFIQESVIQAMLL